MMEPHCKNEHTILRHPGWNPTACGADPTIRKNTTVGCMVCVGMADSMSTPR